MTAMRTAAEPVWIHSLFRAGSTYLLNVFRRSDQGYYCYQEPENEFLVHLDGEPEMLLTMGAEKARALRHPMAADPAYFREFYQIRDKLAGLFRASFCYDDFFIDPGLGLPADQRVYFQTLIDRAMGRPVLQLCRSAGRIRALKEALGGIHLHMWREPRNQWWSYKVNDYFDATLQRIYNAVRLPAVLAAAGDACRVPGFQSDDLIEAFDFARRRPLASEANYFAFYALWLYAFREFEAGADGTIGIDRLSVDAAYRDEIRDRLHRLGVTGIDLSDCAVPRAVFTVEEADFYREIEKRVQGLFLRHGYDRGGLEAVVLAHEAVFQESGQEDGPALLQDARRARQTALRCLDDGARGFALAAMCEERTGHLEGALAAERAHAGHLEKHLEGERERAAALEAQWTAERERVAATEAQLAAAEAAYRAERAHAAALEAQSRSLQAYIQALHNSRSWRITAPLRFISSAAAGGFQWMRTVGRRGVLPVYFLLNQAPGLKRPLARMVAAFPVLERRLRHTLHHRLFGGGRDLAGAPAPRESASSAGREGGNGDARLETLNPRALKIYRHFQRACASRRR